MVSIAIIEKHKENVLPRNRGHNLRALITRLDEQDGLFENELSFSEAPELAESDNDPLQAAVEHIEELRYAQPGNAPTTQLIECLAECIDKFKDSDLYKNNLIFVQLCLEYGAFSESPNSMFEFMESWEIGKHCSSLYLHWANYLETIQLYSRARDVLNQGIRYNAEPKRSLEIELSDLEQRIRSISQTSQPIKASSKKLLLGGLNDGKRRKIEIYRDTTGDDSSETPTFSDPMHHVPAISQEKKENKPYAKPLKASNTPAVPQALSSRRIPVYVDGDSASLYTHELAEATAEHSISFNEMAVRYCMFTGPTRPFQYNVPQPMQVHSAHTDSEMTSDLLKPVGLKYREAIYEQHKEITEVIGKTVLNGATEILK